MPLVASNDEPLSRRAVLSAFLTQGFAGLLALVWITLHKGQETREISQVLGDSLPVLIVIFFLYSAALALLRFELTDLIFVSFVMTALISMFPLLGAVISAWTAVAAVMLARLLGMMQLGPTKIGMRDPVVEWVKLFGLFGTYGIPVVLASTVYQLVGGRIPVGAPTWATAAKIALGCVVLVVSNNLIMVRVEQAYGYSSRKSLYLGLIDSSIYFLTLPFALCLTFSYRGMGWWALLILAFTATVVNGVGRNLALTRSASQQQLQRLASLTSIGRTISLDLPIDKLLASVYAECKKVVDVSIFSIALYDGRTDELSFDLDIREGETMPRQRFPVGEGLNSFVLRTREPLLIGSERQEREMGLLSIDDRTPTESWLGVPMVARDRVIGVISVQSYRRNAFTADDLLLLSTIANQAAVALENSNLYRDLEGLTLVLEQRVSERTGDLREANLRLMAADRSKTQFLANMSHELRTPLNSIIGFSSVLLDSTPDTLPPRLYAFLKNIRQSGSHLLDLINDILDLARIEAGRMELHIVTFDVRRVIADVEGKYREESAAAELSVESLVDPDVPSVRLDEGRLKQILSNLVSNAMKFSPAGGTIRIRATRGSAKSSSRREDALRICVEDEGIGIAADELEKIFDEFYQTEEGRHARSGGTGLGLSLVRRLVELHGGWIDVESAVGRGSLFAVTLPLEYVTPAGTHTAAVITARPRTLAHGS